MADTTFVNNITVSEAVWFNDLNDFFYTGFSGAAGGTFANAAPTLLSLALTRALHFAAEVDVASAATTNIGAGLSNKVRITGTTTITAFDTVAAGTTRWGRFAGALTLTHNATTLILPGAANITTAAGDRFFAVSLGSGNWEVLFYQKASGLAVAQSSAGITLATPIATTSGTTAAFTGIPAGTKRVTVMFNEVSQGATADNYAIQIGDSGGLEGTGYVSMASSSVGVQVLSTGFQATVNHAANLHVVSGSVILSLENSSTNLWVAQGVIAQPSSSVISHCAGSKALSGVLDRLTVYTVGGATFGTGEVNISYE